MVSPHSPSCKNTEQQLSIGTCLLLKLYLFSPLNCAFVCFAGQGSCNASILAYLCFETSTPLFQRFCSPLCPLYDGPNAGGRRGLICRTCHDEWQELPELIASPGDFSMGWVEKRLSTKCYFLRFFDLAQLQKLFFIVNIRIPKKSYTI